MSVRAKSAPTSEVVTHEMAAPVILAEQSGPGAFLAMIERASVNPHVDVAKMERLMDMYERVEGSRAKIAFDSAFSAMQAELPEIDENGQIKNRGEVQSTYSLWEDIDRAAKPVYTKHGFSLRFRPGKSDGFNTVTAILSHNEGHREEATVELPIDSSGAKNAVQGVGSTLSYGKRYSGIMILNIVTRYDTTDDDGQKATKDKAGTSATDAKTKGLWAAAERDMRAQTTERGLARCHEHHKAILSDVRGGGWLRNLGDEYEACLARIRSAEFKKMSEAR